MREDFPIPAPRDNGGKEVRVILLIVPRFTPLVGARTSGKGSEQRCGARLVPANPSKGFSSLPEREEHRERLRAAQKGCGALGDAAGLWGCPRVRSRLQEGVFPQNLFSRSPGILPRLSPPASSFYEAAWFPGSPFPSPSPAAARFYLFVYSTSPPVPGMPLILGTPSRCGDRREGTAWGHRQLLSLLGCPLGMLQRRIPVA